MSASHFAQIFGYFEATVGLIALVCVARSKSARSYWPLIALLGTQVASYFFLVGWLQFAWRVIGTRAAYDIYFYVYYTTFAIESVFAVLTIYALYRMAMEPLKGLQNLGLLVFKWAATISVVIALAISAGSHVNTTQFIMTVVSQMQRASSILTLSLLLFVCLALKPLGLSVRSRVFGVTMGLATMSTVTMAESAWITHTGPMYSAFSIARSLISCGIFVSVAWYFTNREPERAVVMLPTTSPFLKWNQICALLGQNPGYVAVGGFAPDMFATAELEMMRRASGKITDARSRKLQTITPQRTAA